MKNPKLPALAGGTAVALMVLASVGVATEDRVALQRNLPDEIQSHQLAEPATSFAPVTQEMREHGNVLAARGTHQVIVRLSEPSVAEATVKGRGKGQKKRVEAQQAKFLNRGESLAPGARTLGRTQAVLNAVFMEVDANDIAALENDAEVTRVTIVKDYELDLSETVPYIGGTAVQGAGFDGTGVRVAIFDSGIDYTHFDLGGSGNPGDYAANDPNVIEPGSFPTAKVVGGFDFVGSAWPGGPLAPDADPLDDGPAAGHGTHVADIVAGQNGVAPGADLYAVKVCSSVSPSCSGIALIQGMDFAVDPNGDGDVSDHLDVINMSLGADYGQAFDDDLSQAVNNATEIGVLTVASAGNGSDRPYVTGTPAAAQTALSVAQTQVPSAFQPLMEVTAPASIAGQYAAVFQPWSASLVSTISGSLQYGDGAGGNLNGCAPFAPGSLTGLIVLVDRGACFFSDKIRNVGDAGGLVGIIGLVAPGAPFPGGFGGGPPITIPGYMISQADSNTLKSGLGSGVDVRFDPASGISLVQHMVGSSSRGPRIGDNLVKPEIGAPGASVSANAGTGTGTGPFGGTSGAAPMVSGSAALLLQAYPNRTPQEIKAVLMNTGETDIMNEPAFFGGDLAPIARIGGGEVRVDRALASGASAWDRDALGPLSFAFDDVDKETSNLHRWVTVQNHTNDVIHYNVSSSFRFDNDADTGGVEVVHPESVNVPAGGDAKFKVTLKLRGLNLRDWAMNSGSQGANADTMSLFEYDGYVQLTDASNSANDIHVPWHVLPRKAGDISVKQKGTSAKLQNKGVADSLIESYSLIGSNGNLPEGGAGQQSPVPDFRHIGYTTIPVPAGFCSADPSFILAFAVNTWERQTHAVAAPAYFEFDLDTDQDGFFDYAVFNFDLSLSGGLDDGRNVTWVQDLTTGSSTAFFFTDHETNSGNTVLLLCGEQIGMNASNYFQPIDLQALAVEWYFGNGVTDFFTGITISPLGEQYLGVFENGGVGSTVIPRNGQDNLDVLDFGPITNNTETGLLLLHRGGAAPDNEASTVIIQ